MQEPIRVYNHEEHCSPIGLFHSEDSILVKIVDTIEVEGYLVEYLRCHVKDKYKNVIKRKLISGSKDTFRYLESILFYYDSLDINVNLNNLNRNDSILEFLQINYFTSILSTYQNFIEWCGFDTVLNNNYIKYRNLSFFGCLDYDYEFNDRVQTVINDTSHYDKIVHKKHTYSIYLVRISPGFLKRIESWEIIYELEKDGWLYFGIPIKSKKGCGK